MLSRDLTEHLPDSTLEAFLRAWPAEPVAHPRLVHLMVCRRCRRRCRQIAPRKAGMFLRSIADVLVSDVRLDEDSLTRLTELIHRHLAECELGEHRARDLLRLEAAERRAFVRSRRPPVSPVALANGIRVLLPDLVHDRPEDIRHLAALGLQLLRSEQRRLPRTALDIAADLETQAGNACRLLSDPSGAREHLSRAVALATESPDDLLHARVALYTSKLLRDTRRFETAEQLAEQALAIYREAQEHGQAGRIEFQLATISYYRADFEGAVEKLLALKAKDLDAITRLSVTYWLARCHLLLGSGYEAVRLLPEVRQLSSCFTAPSIHVYIEWLKGLILGHSGQIDPAEKLLSKVERFFLERDQLTESALAVLDRADIYGKHGRHQEAAEAARSVIGAFEVTEKRHEALAALRLYVEAERSAKERIAKELRLYLPLAATDPELKYRPGCMIG